MSASAVLMPTRTVSSIRRSLDRLLSACVRLVVACVARVAKAVLALKVKVDSVVRRDHRKVAILLLLVPKAVVPKADLKVAAHRVDRKADALALVALVAKKVVAQDLPVAGCLVTPRNPSNAWTLMRTAVSPRKNM